MAGQHTSSDTVSGDVRVWLSINEAHLAVSKAEKLKIADTYKTIDNNTGWCVDKANSNVYLIYRLEATEEEIKNYDYISILNSKTNETIIPDEEIAEGEDGYNGKFNTVYTAIQFPDESEIAAGKNEYLIAFELSGLTSQPKNFTITTGVNE